MTESDIYNTITKPSKGELFKDKNSKFYGYTFPVTNEEEIRQNEMCINDENYSFSNDNSYKSRCELIWSTLNHTFLKYHNV